ncbi:MAG TPA: anaerobic ribonucleoside-triphosphate reductase activating protein [Lachnospiraceae bacterium]|mgnify:CR=1 FL=1|nr:anaerobic ribonucleoside-triphosphate reductase activating protein [Lachnospiraceae bacterium]
MNYSEIDKIECVNGPGWGVSLFTHGCPLKCKGCHNSSIWDFDGGKEFTKKTIKKIQELIKPDYISRFSILGGEPLYPKNYFPLALLINAIRHTKPDIIIILYTGYKLSEIDYKDDVYLKYILSHIDYLIDGRYEEDKRDITLSFRGSSNQVIWNMKNYPKEAINVSEEWDNGIYK